MYRPPKIAPTTMEEDKKTKQERDVQRRAKDLLRRARQSEYVRSLLADVEERPEEVSFLDVFLMPLFVYYVLFWSIHCVLHNLLNSTGKRNSWTRK